MNNKLSKLFLLTLLAAAPAQGMWNALNKVTKVAQKYQGTIILTGLGVTAAGLYYFKDHILEKLRKDREAALDEALQPNDLTKFLHTAVGNIIRSNSLYENMTQDDFKVVDTSQISIFENYPLGIAPNIHAIKDKQPFTEFIDYIQKKFPIAKHIIVVNPLMFQSRESIIPFVGHELAHITQSYSCSSGYTVYYDLCYLREIDADIKAICTKTTQKTWIVRDDAQDIIEHYSKNFKYLQDLGLSLSSAMHPPVDDRLSIMSNFVKIMKDNFNDSMSDAEFNAIVGILATEQCIKSTLTLSKEFLKLVDLEGAKKLEKVTACMKIPDVEAYCKNQK